MFFKIRRVLTRYFVEMRWYTIVSALLFYGLTSWLLLYSAGEDALLQSNDFIYWLVVTGSTVGYGDMSPVTDSGKAIVAFYIIPLGLSIFAMVIGRVAAWVSEQWRKGVKGLKTLDVENHILVIGWNEQRTMHLLSLLLKERQSLDEKPDIVLCVRAEIENPRPGEIDFVRVSTFTSDEEMNRACVGNAKIIILDNPEDDLTMTTALYCSKRNPNAHKIAYFQDENLVPILKQHCPKVECTPSVAVEMLAKSAFDPGSSLLHHDLLSVQEGQAQFSAEVPESVTDLKAGAVFVNMKQHYNVTFMGFAKVGDTRHVHLNPDNDEQIHPHDKLFYIAPQRLNNINWQLLREH